jgi:hypothetical protein
MELVEDCESVELTRISAWNWAAKVVLKGGRYVGRTKTNVVHTILSAIAEAWLAAHKAQEAGGGLES